MTLRLRRKRPITAQSTLPKKAAKLFGRGLMAAALFGAAFSLAPAVLADDIPQRIQVDDAKPISSVSSNPSGQRLEWRNRRAARNSQAESQFESPAENTTTTNTLRRDSAVIQAVSTAEITDSVELNGPHSVQRAVDLKTIKPIEDPFGDRRTPHVAQRETGSVLKAPASRTPAHVAQEPGGGAFQPNPIRSGQPAPVAPSLEPGDLAPPDNAAPNDLNPPMPQATQPGPFDDLTPQVAPPGTNDLNPVQPAPPAEGTTPRPRSIPRQQPESEMPAEPAPAGGMDKANCDKVFNERNCCAEGEECHRAWKRLSEQRIDQISLDIAASYQPSINDQAEVHQKRKDLVNKVPSRVFTNRAQQTVAEGQLTNLSHGFVSITSGSGQVQRVRFNDLSDVDLCFVAAYWNIPNECALGDDAFMGRCWTSSTMTWKASALCHKPLYFEEVQLERYGHDAGPIAQPFVSAAHFFLTIPVLPYKMGMNPPNECQYALGYYRPGSCAPWMLPAIPLSARGAAAQAGATLGLVYILP